MIKGYRHALLMADEVAHEAVVAGATELCSTGITVDGQIRWRITGGASDETKVSTWRR